MEINSDADCAVLELSEAVVGVAPLQVVAAPSGLEWLTYGFPGLAGDVGLPLNGTIQDSGRA